VQGELAEATVVRERALLLEALTLLVKRQAETETALTAQLARTNARVAAAERRGLELEARLADIDARLQRLASEVAPDPGLPRRVAVLQSQVENLQAAAGSTQAALAVTEPRAPQAVISVAAVAAPAPQAVPSVATPSAPPRQPQAAPLAPRRAALVGSPDTLWDRLGSTNQDRASVVLIGAGVLAVVFAAIAQLRPG